MGQLVLHRIATKGTSLPLLMTIVEKTWVYFLGEKFEAIVVFKIFKAQVGKETGQFIKVFVLIMEVNLPNMNSLTCVR